jgi:hypothetical protein
MAGMGHTDNGAHWALIHTRHALMRPTDSQPKEMMQIAPLGMCSEDGHPAGQPSATRLACVTYYAVEAKYLTSLGAIERRPGRSGGEQTHFAGALSLP